MKSTDVNSRLVFIIAHKYIRGHATYLQYYVSNIRKFYPTALILIIDNNSNYKDEVFSSIERDERIIFIDNNIHSKFEIGAYTVGLSYLITNNLIDEFSYVIMTQDTFVLKNRYDFNNLKNNNVTACPINSWHQDGAYQHMSEHVLSQLGLNNNYDKITFCWCNSFVIDSSKILDLYNLISRIVITRSIEREASERYLARILWELNDHKNFDIDGDLDSLKDKYYCHTVDIINDDVKTFFVKKPHNKKEDTPDQW